MKAKEAGLQVNVKDMFLNLPTYYFILAICITQISHANKCKISSNLKTLSYRKQRKKKYTIVPYNLSWKWDYLVVDFLCFSVLKHLLAFIKSLNLVASGIKSFNINFGLWYQDHIRFLLCDYRQLPKNYKYDRIISWLALSPLYCIYIWK